MKVDGNFTHFYNRHVRKDKWGALYGDFKRIYEYFIRTIGHGDTHWDLTLHDKTQFNKCSSFLQVQHL
jgi:hypothetical protein